MKCSWFDMDHTLIDNDCDVSWKEFVVAEKLADESAIQEADRFYEDYKNGCLNIDDFLHFQLREFIGRTPGEMAGLAKKHFELIVKPTIRSYMLERVRSCIAGGDHVAIITSTNGVLARPVADYFGIEPVMAPELEVGADGRYTGEIIGHYTVGQGKVEAAREFCRKHRMSLSEVAYYGDSINDLPLLRAVGRAVVVTPSPALQKEAQLRNWTIITA